MTRLHRLLRYLPLVFGGLMGAAFAVVFVRLWRSETSPNQARRALRDYTGKRRAAMLKVWDGIEGSSQPG
ncbi:MAG: hypothetical protein ACOC2Q_00420 [Spirochaetota bacterium]